MRKDEVLRHFGGPNASQTETAERLGITKAAVSMWGDVIPELWAWRIQFMTAGALRIDLSLYGRTASGERAA